jgi:uncharacterized protein
MELFAQTENVKHLKGFYDAVEQGDFTAARQYLEPTLEWVGPDAPGLWFGGTHRGPDALFKEVIEPAYGKIGEFRVRMKKFHEVGDHVIAVGRVSGRAKMTGRALDAAVAEVWTLRSGKAVRCQSYHEPAKWLEVLGETNPQAQRLAA